MENQILISIVTPSLNQAAYIERAIQSVVQQASLSYEHIVMDGGSTDGTLSVLNKYPHLRWISEPDEGQSDAVNKAVGMAKGRLIGWLNCDDTYEPGVFRMIESLAKANPDKVLFYGDCNFIDERDRLIRHYSPPELSRRKLTARCYNYIPQPSVFFTRSAFLTLGGLDKTLHYAMDHDLFIKLARIDKSLKLKSTIANFRIHNSSKTSVHWLKMRLESYTVSIRNGGAQSALLHLNMMKTLLEYPVRRLLR